MRHYRVSVCAGCGAQSPSRASHHAKKCPHRRFKWFPLKTETAVPFADYRRVVKALLEQTGAQCTCPPTAEEYDEKCPWHGEDGPQVAIIYVKAHHN